MAESDRDGYRELTDAARRAASQAYAPYSGYRVGSALLSSNDGVVFTGCNVENASYGLSICAERVAATSAVAAGRRSFDALAIFAEGPLLPMPCGACRQFLAEFGVGLVVLVSNGVTLERHLLRDLLPHAFNLQSGKGPAGGGLEPSS